MNEIPVGQATIIRLDKKQSFAYITGVYLGLPRVPWFESCRVRCPVDLYLRTVIRSN